MRDSNFSLRLPGFMYLRSNQAMTPVKQSTANMMNGLRMKAKNTDTG